MIDVKKLGELFSSNSPPNPEILCSKFNFPDFPSNRYHPHGGYHGAAGYRSDRGHLRSDQRAEARLQNLALWIDWHRLGALYRVLLLAADRGT